MNTVRVGKALDAKYGAILLTSDEDVYYIDGLDYWDDSVRGLPVEVTGELTEVSDSSATNQAPSGLAVQRAEGPRKVLKNATWKLAEVTKGSK